MTLSKVAQRAADDLAANILRSTRWLRDAQAEALDSIAASLMARAEKLRSEETER